MFDIQSDLIKLQDSGFKFPNPQYLERNPEQLLSGRPIPNFFKMSTPGRPHECLVFRHLTKAST